MLFLARAWFESWGTVFSPQKKMWFFFKRKEDAGRSKQSPCQRNSITFPSLQM